MAVPCLTGLTSALDADQLTVEYAVGYQLGDVLDDMGLGRDRIGGDHLRPAQGDGAGDGL